MSFDGCWLVSLLRWSSDSRMIFSLCLFVSHCVANNIKYLQAVQILEQNHLALSGYIWLFKNFTTWSSRLSFIRITHKQKHVSSWWMEMLALTDWLCVLCLRLNQANRSNASDSMFWCTSIKTQIHSSWPTLFIKVEESYLRFMEPTWHINRFISVFWNNLIIITFGVAKSPDIF